MRQEVIKSLLTICSDVCVIWKDDTVEDLKHKGKFIGKYKDDNLLSITDDYNKFAIKSITSNVDDEIFLILILKDKK